MMDFTTQFGILRDTDYGGNLLDNQVSSHVQWEEKRTHHVKVGKDERRKQIGMDWEKLEGKVGVKVRERSMVHGEILFWAFVGEIAE